MIKLKILFFGITTDLIGASTSNESFADGISVFDFKNELIDLYVQNIIELENSLAEAWSTNDIEKEEFAIHKVKTTLRTLKQDEFLQNLSSSKDDVNIKRKLKEELSSICINIKEQLKALKDDK